jgi:hypothetical protein
MNDVRFMSCGRVSQAAVLALRLAMDASATPSIGVRFVPSVAYSDQAKPLSFPNSTGGTRFAVNS